MTERRRALTRHRTSGRVGEAKLSDPYRVRNGRATAAARCVSWPSVHMPAIRQDAARPGPRSIRLERREMDETTATCYGTVGSLNKEPPMRFILPLMFSLVVSAAPVYAQPSGSVSAENNCGTPDQPKPCAGSKTASKSHKATSKTTKPSTQ